MSILTPRLFSHSAIILVAGLVGCAMVQESENKAPPPPPAPVVEVAPPKPVSIEPAPEQVALNQGIALYNDGNYAAAVKKLSAAGEIWAGDKGIQVQAHKYMAFSYCVMGRHLPCRQEFDKALKLDPSFDLEPGEKGHPLWGPVFEKAKKEMKPRK
jgi:Tfp pilus assembly protein PilF